MRNLFLSVVLLFSVVVFGQENYKTSHPVSEFVNKAPHQMASFDVNKKFASKPKRIILLIGDGMGITQVYSAYTANAGKLNITSMPYVGFLLTYSYSNYITDSGAGGTAIACGVKTNNGAIGVGPDGKAVSSVLKLSEASGLATGLVATSAITHATPASFIANVASRSSYEDIALDFLKTDVDVFIGGGRKHFEERMDGRNLSNDLRNKGYVVANSIDDVAAVKTGKLAVLGADEHTARYPERGDLLPLGTQKAIEILNHNKKGFFLMVEGSQIDWGGHQNDAEYVVNETLDFDKAVGKALEFAAKDKHTLVIVTADHETGGMSLVGGNIKTGEVKAAFNTGDHSAVMVPVFAYGAGAEQFKGVYENTDLFVKMVELLRVGSTSRKR